MMQFKATLSHIRSSGPARLIWNPISNKTKQNSALAQNRDAALSLSICTLWSCGCGTGRDEGSWSILLLLCGPRLCSVHPSCLNLFTSPWDLPRTPAEPANSSLHLLWGIGSDSLGPGAQASDRTTCLCRGRTGCPKCFQDISMTMIKEIPPPACLFLFCFVLIF